MILLSYSKRREKRRDQNRVTQAQNGGEVNIRIYIIVAYNNLKQ